MLKYLFAFFSILSLLSADTYLCKAHSTLMTIDTHKDDTLNVNINGIKYSGVLKGTTVDGKTILHYMYASTNIWIHSQKHFKNVKVRFNSDFENMTIVSFDCKKYKLLK